MYRLTKYVKNKLCIKLVFLYTVANFISSPERTSHKIKRTELIRAFRSGHVVVLVFTIGKTLKASSYLIRVLESRGSRCGHVARIKYINWCKIQPQKPEGKESLAKSRHIWWDSTKICFK